MPLNKKTPYFLKEYTAVLRLKPSKKTHRNAVNHLIFGDKLVYLDISQDGWSKFSCRKSIGWLKDEWVTTEQHLEVNFVDLGQGDGCHIVTPDDRILLIDAGEGKGFHGKGGDNMYRFLNWRYNLRKRGEEEVNKVVIDYAIISHPDLDHYYGFESLFEDPNLIFKTIGHNGIVERSIHEGSSSTWLYDFGRKVPPVPYKRDYHLWDTVTTDEEMKSLIRANPTTGKYYLKMLNTCLNNNPDVNFQFIHAAQETLADFTEKESLKIAVLGPVTESIQYEGEQRTCLRKLGNEGITKNGHSVIFQFYYKHIKLLLGGDLNEKSQDYLAQHHTNSEATFSELEKKLKKLQKKARTSTNEEIRIEIEETEGQIETMIKQLKPIFGCDIAKACHHGSADFSDHFLKAIHPIATVISSGDNESHSHPRPDALGTYGKAGRGTRPLIFSTELARSTHEFTYPFKYFNLIKAIEKRMNELTDPKAKEIYRLRMEKLRDSNVARYGMITIRTDGERAIIAQKLEKERSAGSKWDWYALEYDPYSKGFVRVE